MNLEKEIASSILHWPSLHRRSGIKEALNSMYCMVGSGFEWEEGKIASEETPDISDEVYEAFKVLEDFSSRGLFFSWSQISEWSLILNVPDDVDPSFMEGAVKVAQLIKDDYTMVSSGEIFVGPYRNREKIAKTLKHNHELTKHLLEK